MEGARLLQNICNHSTHQCGTSTLKIQVVSWSLTISYMPYQIVFIKDYDYCYLSRICTVLKIIYLQQTMILGKIVN